MKKLLCFVCALSLWAFSSNLYAYGVVISKIEDIRVDMTGKVIVYFEKPIENPTCGAAPPTELQSMAFNLSSAGGDGTLSLLLSAYHTGKVVKARGAGVCTDFSDTFENIQYVILY